MRYWFLNFFLLNTFKECFEEVMAIKNFKLFDIAFTDKFELQLIKKFQSMKKDY